MDTKQPDLTRQKLLQAAFCEIHRQGFQAASITHILADTGLTKGALYHHFPTKQALGLAVIEEVVGERLNGLIFNPLRASERPVETLLEIIANVSCRVDEEYLRLGCPLNNLMQEMSPLDAGFKTQLNRVLTTWQKTVEDALERSRKQGALRAEVDTKAAALFIVSAWEGCVGIAKNLQSLETFSLCMKQLHDYIVWLTVPSSE